MAGEPTYTGDKLHEQFAISIAIDKGYAGARLFSALSPLQSLRITRWDAEGGIEEAADPNYTQNEVYGRAEPYQSYNNTGARTITISCLFHCENGDPKQEVVIPSRFLDALKYPLYDTAKGISYAPPPVFLEIGQLISARCVITACSVKWVGPFEPVSLLPHGSEVSLTLTVVRSAQRVGYAFDGVWK